jgi:hypothetical protein
MAAHLNTRPLVRSTRKLTPTDAGAAYLAACRRILEQVGDAERTASGEYSAPRGDLKLLIVLREFEPEPMSVSLIHASLPLKMRSFLGFATPRLRKALAADPAMPREATAAERERLHANFVTASAEKKVL